MTVDRIPAFFIGLVKRYSLSVVRYDPKRRKLLGLVDTVSRPPHGHNLFPYIDVETRLRRANNIESLTINVCTYPFKREPTVVCTHEHCAFPRTVYDSAVDVPYVRWSLRATALSFFSPKERSNLLSLLTCVKAARNRCVMTSTPGWANS